MKVVQHAEQQKLWAAMPAPECYKAHSIADAIVSCVAPFIGSAVLDVGAGTGALLQCISRRFPRSVKLTGIDMEPHGELVQRGDCRALSWQDASFDTVLCTDVIEHLPDDDLTACLKEIHRVLSPNGHAIFTTVNNEQLVQNIVTCPFCSSVFHRWGHVRSFSVATLSALLASHGFCLVLVRSIGFGFLANFGLAARTWYALRLDVLVPRFAHITNSDLLAVVQKTD